MLVVVSFCVFIGVSEDVVTFWEWMGSTGLYWFFVQ